MKKEIFTRIFTNKNRINTNLDRKFVKIRIKFAIICAILFFSNAVNASVTKEVPQLIMKSWDAWGSGNYTLTYEFTDEFIGLHQEEALMQAKGLSDFPANPDNYQAYNNVATAYFIKAEALRDDGKTEEAIKTYNKVIEDFSFAKGWDPRGWYWKVADTAKKSLEKLIGTFEEEEKRFILPTFAKDKLNINNPGSEEIIDYEKYGEFLNVGTKDYRYKVTDRRGLAEAAGDGIYPSNSVYKDPEYKRLKKITYQGKRFFERSHWDFVNTGAPKIDYYKWATTGEAPNTKLFYTAYALEKAGKIKHAIKAYYALIVHFPEKVSWTYWQTPWSPAQVAISKIEYLLKNHPEINWKLVGADVRIKNGFDSDSNNDVVITNPGKLVCCEQRSFWGKLLDKWNDFITYKKRTTGIKSERGKGKVRVVQFNSGDWQLLVNEKPFMLKAVTYTATRVGQTPNKQTLTNWMNDDFNANGKADGPYDSWVDKNGNNQQDADEPVIGDFQLMKDMGINTVRVYKQPFEITDENIKLLRRMYKDFGIMVLMGDFLGKYALGSGASWAEGTDYENPQHLATMMKSVEDMVMRHKDEPYLLMWILGNENNYGVACNADTKPKAFYNFVNKVAKRIHELDPDHPVAICSGETIDIDIMAQYAPEVDIFSCNSYRGKEGFGRLWRDAKEEFDRPVFISEYGCPAVADIYSRKEALSLQEKYHQGCWEDIEANRAGKGVGNSIGGVIFEWMDEWWKSYDPYVHDIKGLFAGPFPDGYMHEEWLGICGQGDGGSSPFLRVLRPAYCIYKEMWR